MSIVVGREKCLVRFEGATSPRPSPPLCGGEGARGSGPEITLGTGGRMSGERHATEFFWTHGERMLLRLVLWTQPRSESMNLRWIVY